MIHNNIKAFFIHVVISFAILLLLGEDMGNTLLKISALCTVVTGAIIYTLCGFFLLNYRIKPILLSSVSVAVFLELVTLWAILDGTQENWGIYTVLNPAFTDIYGNITLSEYIHLVLSVMPSVFLCIGMFLRRMYSGRVSVNEKRK